MAYTKNTWTDGDIVTSAKLNHMEDGIANAYKMLHVGNVTMNATGNTGTLDKTWQEIFDAVSSGNICCFTGAPSGDGLYRKTFIIDDVYQAQREEHPYVISALDGTELSADSPTQRPTIGTGDGGDPS